MLEEHEVRRERLLRRVRVLDVSLATLARLALRRAERVLSLNRVGSEGLLPCGELALSRLLGRLGASLEGL